MSDLSDCVQLHTTDEASSVVIDTTEPPKIINAANASTDSTTPTKRGQPNLCYHAANRLKGHYGIIDFPVHTIDITSRAFRAQGPNLI